MLEKLLSGIYTGLLILGGIYIAATFMQVRALEVRVTALEQDAAAWDITIVRPILPGENNE